MAKIRRRSNPINKKGLPHQSDEIAKKARLLNSPYDEARAELGLKKEVLEPEEITQSIESKLSSRAEIKKRQDEINAFKRAVDFKKHLEAVVVFKYDIQGFLSAIKTKFNDDPLAKDMYNEYARVERKLNELIQVLKAL